MPGALNQLVGSHQRIPGTGTLNFNLRALVFLSCVGRIVEYKGVCSYPSVVRFFQISELNSSLGVPEQSYMLEITYQLHIGFLGKAIENSGS